MGLLEDALRNTFAGQVAAPPLVDDLADRAIRRAGGVRRRRVGLTSVAAVLTLVLVGGVGFALVNRNQGTLGSTDVGADATGQMASPSATVPGVLLPIDVVMGNRIQVSDGSLVPLGDIGEPRAVWRVDGGWLVRTSQSGAPASAVWFVDPSGTHTQLAAGDSTMVSRGNAARPGAQVAWTENGRLHLATFAGGQLTAGVATLGVGTMSPQRVVGNGVLLAGTRTGGGLDIWDMWFPDKGAFVEDTTSAQPSAVLGSTVDNKQLYALYGGKPPCFGMLDPVGFVPMRSSCTLPFGLDDRVYPSPDGKWWVVQNSGGLAQYNSTLVWAQPAAVRQWPMTSTNLAWVTDHSLVVASDGFVSLINLDTGALDNIELRSPGAGGLFEVVEDLRT